MFCNVDKEVILSILLSRFEVADKLMWYFSSDGQYTVKLCYRALTMTKFESSSNGLNMVKKMVEIYVAFESSSQD